MGDALGRRAADWWVGLGLTAHGSAGLRPAARFWGQRGVFGFWLKFNSLFFEARSNKSFVRTAFLEFCAPPERQDSKNYRTVPSNALLHSTKRRIACDKHRQEHYIHVLHYKTATGARRLLPNTMEEVRNFVDSRLSNFLASFSRLKPEGWIRLVWIVGAYLLLRPYLMKLGARAQERQHEKESAEAAPTGAEVHPNELRGGKKKVGIAIPGAESDDEETTEAKPGQWGKKARVRQRKYIRSTLEKEEKRLQDEQDQEDLKEIADLLED